MDDNAHTVHFQKKLNEVSIANVRDFNLTGLRKFLYSDVPLPAQLQKKHPYLSELPKITARLCSKIDVKGDRERSKFL